MYLDLNILGLILAIIICMNYKFKTITLMASLGFTKMVGMGAQGFSDHSRSWFAANKVFMLIIVAFLWVKLSCISKNKDMIHYIFS
jgi:hypothetical protein